MLYMITTDADPVNISMVVIYTSTITFDAVNFLQMFSDLETSFISVERCVNFQQIKPEANYFNFLKEEKSMISLTTNVKKLKPNSYAPSLKKQNYNIIKEGRIQFVNVSAKYPMKKDYVLKNLNFEVRPGEKIGVVGRTGAGKTSLIKMFWRCLDPCEGEIFIDGKNIMETDLKTLRTEMDVVSQETSLFEGTLRENLDPQSNGDTDADLMHILQELKFKSGTDFDLEMLINSDGSN